MKLKKQEINEVFLNLIFSISIFIPLFFYLKPSNIIQISNDELKYLFNINIFIALTIIILSLIINFFYKKKDEINTRKIILFFSFLYFLLFFFESFRNVFAPLNIERVYSFYLVIIFYFFLYILLFFFFIKFNFYFLKFIKIFFIFNIIFFFLMNFEGYKNLFKNSVNDKKIIKNNFPNSPLKKNIYFIILDAMMDQDLYLDQKFENKKNVKNKIKLLEEQNFKIIKNSFSSYNLTYLVLTSLIYGDYFVTEKSKRYFSREFFFPNMIKYNDPENMGLITFLRKNKNDFYYLNSTYLDIELKHKKNSNLKRKVLLNNNYFYQFFHSTPLDEFLRFSEKFFKKKNNSKFYFPNYHAHDTLGRFMEYLKNKNFSKEKTKSFYIVHHYSPHPPYIFDNNCNIVSEYKDTLKGYANAYSCALKKINNFLKLISKLDKESIVVVQGDHANSERSLKNIERFKIFNGIRLPNKCRNNSKLNKIENNINTNINMLLYSISCSTGEEVRLLDNKSYAGYYEHDYNYGLIEKVR